MEEGSLRCDANVSIRPKGSEKLGTKVEIKNVNSFKFIQRAIEYEIKRQEAVIESGSEIVQETRLYDADKGVTFSMRTKKRRTTTGISLIRTSFRWRSAPRT